MKEGANLFDDYYYAHDCGIPYVRNNTWLSVFAGIADRIVAELSPKTVMDAGCAKGFLVETLRDRDVDARGVDISERGISQVYDPIKPYCKVGSITEPFGQKYDLITSVEVVEHMQKEDAEKAIANLCAHTDVVLFSSTPNDFSETTHFNVQQPEVWAREFVRHGFYRDLDFDATFVSPWAMLFRKSTIAPSQLVYAYERKLWLLVRENKELRQANVELSQKTRDLEAKLDHNQHLTKAQRFRRLLKRKAPVEKAFDQR